MEDSVLNKKELTFEEVFRLTKKGWVRVLIYCLVGLIVATSLMVVVRTLTSPVEYTTKIVFTTDSINSSESWNPSSNIIEIVKSDVVIRSAIDECGFSDEEQEKLLSSGLKGCIGVTTISTMSDTKGNEYPSTVKVSIRKSNKLDLSKSQYESILKYIVKKSLDYIKSSYSYNVSFDTQITEDYKLNNYLQVYNRLSSSLESYSEFLNSASEDLVGFNSSVSKTSIKMLKTNISMLDNELNSIYSYLATKAVANNSTSISSSELDYATNQASYLSQKESTLSARITQYAELLQNVKPVINNYATGEVAINTDYYKYLETYNQLQEEYGQVKQELAKWQTIKTAYGSQDSSESANATIQAMYNSFISNFNDACAALEQTVDDYNKNGILSSIVYEKDAIQKEIGETFGAMVIMLIDVVLFVLLYALSLYVTAVKEKRLNNSLGENK